MSENILLSTAFFAPVQFYTHFLANKNVYIEQHENFIKQTYRNRCKILGANGPVALIVPVVKGRGAKKNINDIKISYEMNWQRNMWQTIVSAYNSSPFFEYYEHDFQPFFSKKWEFLIDYNFTIHQTICELLEIENKIILTSDFEEVPDGTYNYRELITPKKSIQIDKHFKPEPYTQVFSEKFNFVPNLSILDLIFNEGPNSYTNLLNSFVP